jgi:hypothetical protein
MILWYILLFIKRCGIIKCMKSIENAKVSTKELLRQNALKEASATLGAARSREGALHAQNPNNNVPDGPRKRYNPEGLERNANILRTQAAAHLGRACLQCPLSQACLLANNLSAWEHSHPVGGPTNTTSIGEETRKGMLSRIKKKSNSEHIEPCDDSKINRALLPTEQLTFNF